MAKYIHASDFTCCACKKAKAVKFWPAIDPDIQSHPYCQKCLDDVFVKLWTEMMIKGEAFFGEENK